MASYIFNIINLKSSSTHIPFEITDWTGAVPENFSGRMFMVKTGDCFSTFSYANKNKVKIEGLESGFEWPPNAKIYMDFKILYNLQASGGFIKCSQVGSGISNAASDTNNPDPTGWIDYPYMFRTFPQDIKDDKGFVKKIAEGKRQTHAYLLLGIRSDDTDPYGSGAPGPLPTGDSFQVVQKINTNLLMMMGGHNGVPVSFAMPWFAGCEPSGENFANN